MNKVIFGCVSVNYRQQQRYVSYTRFHKRLHITDVLSEYRVASPWSIIWWCHCSVAKHNGLVSMCLYLFAGCLTQHNVRVSITQAQIQTLDKNKAKTSFIFFIIFYSSGLWEKPMKPQTIHLFTINTLVFFYNLFICVVYSRIDEPHKGITYLWFVRFMGWYCQLIWLTF